MKTLTRAADDRRKESKGGWWQYVCSGAGVQLKGYGTWVQIARIGEVKDSGPMDCSVKDFRLYLDSILPGD